MSARRFPLYAATAFAAAILSAPLATSVRAVSPQATAQAPARTPDVIFVPTPEQVVEAMLKVAKVGPGDVVYDLGCGDGRIVIAAAQKHGARGVGIDIDPERIQEATANAARAGVNDRVKFMQADLFTTDISEATVVTLYLLPSLNEKLMPKLMKELRPGTRVVSHAFGMPDSWPPEQKLDVDGRTVYFWTIPKR